MKKKRILIAIAATLLVAIPAFAVFNEKDLAHTLSVLRFELHMQNERMENSRKMLDARNERQHEQMIEMVKKCNELSLILYSQNQDFTFDMTYALKEVTNKYEEFSNNRMPYDEIVTNLNLEIERYERLIESLRRLPPILDEIDELPDSIKLSKDSIMTPLMVEMAEHAEEHDHEMKHEHGHEHGDMIEEFAEDGHNHDMTFFLDEQGQADRDTCLRYARNLLKMFTEARDRIVADSDHYAETSNRLKEAYDYAQGRYHLIQRNIFINGQDNYFKVLSTLPSYTKRAFSEAARKYGRAKTFDDGCENEKENVLGTVAEVVGLKEAEEHDHEFENMDEHHDGDLNCTEPEHHHHHHEGNQSEWRGPIVAAFSLLVLFYILLASGLSTGVVHILRKKVARFNTPEFKARQACLTLFCGVIIFALTIMIANRIVSQNFIVMACSLLLIFAWLVSAILLSILIRVPAEKTLKTLKVYLPMIVLGLVVITFRITFIPNKLINLFFPPFLIGFAVWQYLLCKKSKKEIQKSDYIYGWISFVLMASCSVIAVAGYVLLSVQVFIWWLFQLAAIATVTAIYDLLNRYEEIKISKKIKEYKKEHVIINDKKKGALIEVTWFFDLVKDMVVPIVAILTIPFSLWLAADVFDLTEVCKTIFFKPFFNLADKDGNAILHLSLFKILVVSELFFIFRYIAYIIKAFYRHIRLQHHMSQSGKDYVHTNEINFTLADNLVSILVWGTYVIMTIVLLKIPMGAISVVAAGLATGIGLAMKDVLNNFIYGIQLMSGRLRVGDYIDCDGIRGKVESITYQSTQIHALDGSIMAITNTALFNKNFKNLTKNNSYELVKIPVGVHYGANVTNVREVILKALEPIQRKDEYGRWIVDPTRGITLAFNDFGDSSVDLVVKQFVIVEKEAAYIAEAKEAIYNALNENNIEIPFPQRDVYIRQIPTNITNNNQ